MIPVYQIVFYVFAITLVGAALMVVFAKNPVRSILSLVLCFFCSSILWMMLQAEFLSLVLIFVYVGAVMTLFLFVVMMLNIDLVSLKESFVKYLPFALAVSFIFIALLITVFVSKHSIFGPATLIHHPANYSNTAALGSILFSKYLYAFEVAAAILLVAMISAIALAFYGRKAGKRTQNIRAQHAVTKAERLRIVKMKGEEQS